MADNSFMIDPRFTQSPASDATSISRKKIANEQAAEKAAKDFESVFLTEMLKPMTESVNLPAPFGGGFGEKTYRSLLTKEYANAIANAGGLGIAPNIKAELLKAQEQRQ